MNYLCLIQNGEICIRSRRATPTDCAGFITVVQLVIALVNEEPDTKEVSFHCKEIAAALAIDCSADELDLLTDTEMEMEEAAEKLGLVFETTMEDILTQTGSRPTEAELESFVPSSQTTLLNTSQTTLTTTTAEPATTSKKTTTAVVTTTDTTTIATTTDDTTIADTTDSTTTATTTTGTTTATTTTGVIPPCPPPYIWMNHSNIENLLNKAY